MSDSFPTPTQSDYEEPCKALRDSPQHHPRIFTKAPRQSQPAGTGTGSFGWDISPSVEDFQQKPDDVDEAKERKLSKNNQDTKLKTSEEFVFCPPLYRQRYIKVAGLIMSASNGNFSKVVDFGSSELGFLEYLLGIPGLREIVMVDKDSRVLENHANSASQLEPGRIQLCQQQLTVKLVCGDAQHYHPILAGAHVVTMVELIEHIELQDLPAIVKCVFHNVRPWLVIVTTPNADFNKYFPDFTPGSFRHPDHKFEWTAAEFKKWCEGIVKEHPNYSVQYSGCGLGPSRSYCTQIAAFMRRPTPPIKKHPCSNTVKQSACSPKNSHLVSEATMIDTSEATGCSVYKILREIEYSPDKRTQEEQDWDNVMGQLQSLKRFLQTGELTPYITEWEEPDDLIQCLTLDVDIHDPDSMPQHDSNPLTQHDSNPLTQHDSNPLTQHDSNSLTQHDSNPLIQHDSNPLTQHDSNPLTQHGPDSLTQHHECPRENIELPVRNSCPESLDSSTDYNDSPTNYIKSLFEGHDSSVQDPSTYAQKFTPPSQSHDSLSQHQDSLTKKIESPTNHSFTQTLVSSDDKTDSPTCFIRTLFEGQDSASKDPSSSTPKTSSSFQDCDSLIQPQDFSVKKSESSTWYSPTKYLASVADTSDSPTNFIRYLFNKCHDSPLQDARSLAQRCTSPCQGHDSMIHQQDFPSKKPESPSKHSFTQNLKSSADETISPTCHIRYIFMSPNAPVHDFNSPQKSSSLIQESYSSIQHSDSQSQKLQLPTKTLDSVTKFAPSKSPVPPVQDQDSPTYSIRYLFHDPDSPTCYIEAQDTDPTTKNTDLLAQKTDSLAQNTDSTTKNTDPISQSTDSTTKNTDPVTQSTDPTSKNTDSLAQSTDPSTKNIDPIAQSTDPLEQSTDPLAQSTDSTTKNIDILAQSTDPITKNTGPLAQSTDPTIKNIGPLAQSTDPITKNTGPLAQSTDPTTKNTDPLVQSTDPTTKNTVPLAQSTDPTTKNNDPIAQSTDPTTKNNDPTTQNTVPLAQSTDSLTKNNDPLAQSIDPTTRNTDPTTQNTDPLVQSTDPTQNTDPLAQNTDPMTKNNDPLTQSTDPTTKNTDPLAQSPAPTTKNTDPLAQSTDPLAQNTDPTTKNTNSLVRSTDSPAQILELSIKDMKSASKLYEPRKLPSLQPNSISADCEDLVFFGIYYFKNQESVNYQEDTEREYNFYVINNMYAIVPMRSLLGWIYNNMGVKMSSEYVQRTIEDQFFETTGSGDDWKGKMLLWDEEDPYIPSDFNDSGTTFEDEDETDSTDTSYTINLKEMIDTELDYQQPEDFQ